jgi:rubrerythrin
MKLFDIAIKMELEGEAFYRELAKKAVAPGFKNILTMLADDEVAHRHAFEAMQKNSPVVLPDEEARKLVTDAFAAIEKEEFLKEQSQLELYEKALEIELKSIEFYSEQLEELTREDHQKVLEKIIHEERRHYDMIDDIIVMVERPESWVEHAEFGVREDY